MQETLGITPLSHSHQCLSFLISIPMKRLLFAIGDAR
jgi:hypothetical protein